MSPRSEEFMAMARDRAALARTALDAGFPTGAVSAAYYAMLYAARAALSEEDRYAKTHSGTWSLFGQLFASTGRFDRGLLAQARKTQEQREGADYEAVPASPEDADAIIGLAERFIAAVDELVEN